MKENKNYILYLVPYLTICGALYHITFWEKFSINGLAFISLPDILKSAIYPVFSILISVVYNLTIQNLILPSTADGTVKPLTKKKFSGMTMLIYYFAINTTGTFIFRLTGITKDPSTYIFYGGLNAIAASLMLTNSDFLVGQFSTERMRRLVIDLIVFIPVISYYTGKFRSQQIYENLEYKYIINVKTIPTTTLTTSSYSSDTLKFIANTDKHFVFTDLKNLKMYFIKTDIIDTLVMYDKK